MMLGHLLHPRHSNQESPWIKYYLPLEVTQHFHTIFLSFFIYLFGVLRRFQHCTGHITTGSWKGRGNQYIQFVRVLYCKLPTNGKQLPAFPLEAMPGTEPRPQRWEARVLPLCHRGPIHFFLKNVAWADLQLYYLGPVVAAQQIHQ